MPGAMLTADDEALEEALASAKEALLSRVYNRVAYRLQVESSPADSRKDELAPLPGSLVAFQYNGRSAAGSSNGASACIEPDAQQHAVPDDSGSDG